MIPERREAPQGALAETLRKAHRSVEAGLERVTTLLGARRPRAAGECLRDCREIWEGQSRLEEELLYPLFELRLGTAGGGTAAMREEHRDLREVFGRLEAQLGRGQRSPAGETLDALQALLRSHFSREARVLYPTLDAMLNDRERGSLLTRVEAG